MEEDKTNNIITRHTVEKADGGKGFDLMNALLEIDVRVKTFAMALREREEALGEAGAMMDLFDRRLKELEGKKTIDIISTDQAKIILKGG